jgi:hypothetical protein
LTSFSVCTSSPSFVICISTLSSTFSRPTPLF